MAHRNIIQLRAIKRYAHALHIDIEAACKRWCENGLAKRWGDVN